MKIILFDGVCNLCNASVRFVHARDKNDEYRFAFLQSPVGKKLAERAGIKAGDLSSFILLDKENCYTKSEAWLRILRSFGGLWKAVAVLSVIPAALRDGIYDYIGKRRYKYFGRTSECQVPKAGLQEKIIQEKDLGA